MRYLHLLDRNAVSLIKEHNSGKVQTDPKKVKFLDHLKSLDRPENLVTPLLSIIEGEKGREDSGEEKAVCQRKESEAIRVFFRFATTDSDNLDAMGTQLSLTFTAYQEGQWAARAAFLKVAAPLIVQPVAKAKRREAEDKLIAAAASEGLAHDDVLNILCLATLHESEHARALLKPKLVNAYNVLSDLQFIHLTQQIKSIAQKHHLPIHIAVVSMDEGLLGAMDHIEFHHCDFIDDSEFQMKIRYPTGLFPGLSDSGYADLMNKLAQRH